MDSMIYEPREDSYLMQKYVEKYCKKGFTVLDMGTGTGIQGITAAKKAKKVISCDINPDALRYAKEEAEKIKNISFFESDLFSNIPKNRFDLIIFNPPYLPEEKEIENTALFSAKRGTETTVRFLDEANRFLDKEGIILLIGSSLASKANIEEAINNNLLSSEILETEHIFFEDIYIMKIVKSVTLKKIEELGVKDARLFAKGKRGIIIKGEYKKKTVAIKMKRDTSTAMGTIDNESRFLEKLNKEGIGARLIMHDIDFLMYEFVEGELILDFIEKGTKKDILKMLKEVFDQLFTLDKLGINKFEMHHPVKHVLVTKDKKPILIDAKKSKISGISKTAHAVLIDFERARFTEDPKNVTQFCDFLRGDDMQRRLNEKGIAFEKDRIISLAKKYKEKICLASYKKIKGLLK